MTDPKNTRPRDVTCDLCGTPTTRRQSVDCSRLGMGRICKSHTAPCRICGHQQFYTNLVEVPLGQTLKLVCSDHEGVAANMLQRAPEAQEMASEAGG